MNGTTLDWMVTGTTCTISSPEELDILSSMSASLRSCSVVLLFERCGGADFVPNPSCYDRGCGGGSPDGSFRTACE